MEKGKNVKFPFRLQFFAEGNGSDGQNGDANQNGAENANGANGANGENNGAENQNGGVAEKSQRTFTQEEVSRMMTREKQQGKQSVLNALGFKSEDDAKSAFNLLKALQDSQKSEQEKAEESKNTAVQQKADAEKRAELAEAKLACVVNGVDNDSIDDVLTIAMSKVTDDKNLDAVLSEMKTQAKYSSFFKSESGNGTGTPPKNNNEGGKSNEADYGKHIAESFGSKSNSTTKSKFF